MQIIGDDFVKKVQLKQEKEELEKKLSELDETRISMGNINLTNNLNNAYKGIDNNDDMNEMNRLQQNINYDDSNEFDNIMLNQQQSGDDNKKKYLILGIVLVVLFLLTIIIIRLLTGDAKKEDPFTSNNQNSSEMKALSENSGNIEDRYQRILDDKAKKDGSEISTNQQNSSNDRLDMIKETKEEAKLAQNENFSDNSIPNETLDETIKKIEEKKQISKTNETNVATATKQQTESKKSIRDLVEGNTGTKTTSQASTGVSGYFIQIGAFSKRPSEAYLKNITNQGFKYKVIQEDVKGNTFNKLLIGPYSNRAAASSDLPSVKSKLNIQNTFIVNH